MGFALLLWIHNPRLCVLLVMVIWMRGPSFAPNGSMIMYATADQGRGVLAAVSADGRVKQKLRLTEGDVREPSWSPFR